MTVYLLSDRWKVTFWSVVQELSSTSGSSVSFCVSQFAPFFLLLELMLGYNIQMKTECFALECYKKEGHVPFSGIHSIVCE